MNEQLQKATATLIEKSISAFDSGATFMSEQIPEVIHQLLLWQMVYSGGKAICAVLLMIIFVVVDYKTFKHLWSTEHDAFWNDKFIGGYLLCGTGIRFLWAIPLSMINFTWLQIWIAPKIFLLEYAAKLVK